jgi:hypothetical protein
MPLILKIVSFDAEIETFRVGFFSNYQKAENIYIYWYDLKNNILIAGYTCEFNSSVWIFDKEKHEKFAQVYTVLAGGWHGIDSRGRWKMFKKTDGEIIFEDVLNFNQDEYSKSIETIFTIIKHRFSTLIRIEINNETAGHLTFACKKNTFNPSNKIYLHHREENKFINAVDILQFNGLGLIESNFKL